MHISVPNKTGHERQNSDDDNRGCARDPWLIAFAHGSESQSAGDAIDCTPSNTRDRVQDDWKAIWEVEGKREPGERQLAKAELRTKCGEVGNWDGAEKVEKYDGEDRGSEFEIEHGSTEGPEGEGCCRSVRRKPHPHAVGQALGVVPLIGEDSFNPSRLDTV